MTMEVYFVTGTGTDVGKTYCASRFVETCRKAGKRVGVYKPVASGCIRSEDGDWIASDAVELWRAAGCPLSLQEVCPQRFAAPLAPPQAASAVAMEVDETLLLSGVDIWDGGSRSSQSRTDVRFDLLIVEGAGGLFSPISKTLLNVDFALRLRDRMPRMRVVLIALNHLGAIHECVATVRAARDAGVTIDQIVLNTLPSGAVNNDESIATNARHIHRWTGCRVVERW